MDAQTAPRPTGRRKITPAQAAAEAAGPVPLPPTKPGRVLAGRLLASGRISSGSSVTGDRAAREQRAVYNGLVTLHTPLNGE